LTALAVAHLSSTGQKQEEIARGLRLSQPDVSRLREHAKEQGWLEEATPRFLGPAKSPELWERAHARFFSSADLLGKLRGLQG
ncbi:hypothetical protein, partial [Salmonella sp. SAL4450]|uniref:hypothetical protein n=1 Tax=Salmonella sp. SAL4450 TaxID=3159905 RepID=UPI00397D7994